MKYEVSLKSRFSNPSFNYALLKKLPDFLPRQRWFMEKSKSLKNCRVEDVFRVTEDSVLAVLQFEFEDGTRQLYQMPLAQLEHKDDQRRYLKENANMVLLQVPGGPYIVDAVPLPAFRKAVYALIRDGADTRDGINCEAGRMLKAAPANARSVVPAIDSSNTAIIYDDKYFFKLFRKLDPGLNPDLELVRHLSEHTDFDCCPPYGGSLGVGEMHDDNYLNLGMLSGKVDNRGDAWDFFQELTERYFTEGGEVDQETLDRAVLLGQRTAEMHLALGAPEEKPKLFSSVGITGGADAGAMMAPEAMTAAYRDEITEAATKLLHRQVTELAAKKASLSPEMQIMAQAVLDLEPKLTTRLNKLRASEMTVDLIRIHADYHLGQVLVTEDDFYIIDFEGEPLLSIPERRRRRPALKDVAGMVRSFHYAANGQLLLNPERYADQDAAELKERADAWFQTVSTTYLQAYFERCGEASFLPASDEDRQLLLDLFVLEKAVYEVAYELNSRPHWLAIPLSGVLALA